MRIEDKILLVEIHKRNIEVLESLFYEYRSDLIRYAEQFVFDIHECEDIVEDLFIYLWENGSKIDITTSLKSYLYQSVRNRCFNHLKKIKIVSKHHEIYQKQLDDNLKIPIDKTMFRENKVRQAIESLPKQMAEIVRMKYLQEKKHKEIAMELNISETTVKTQLSRARVKLIRLLQNLYSFLITLLF